MINYNIIYSKIMHQNFFKVFYNKLNKKRYNLQIQQYNIYYNNTVIIKDIIILKKVKKKEKPLKNIADMAVLVKMT